MRRILVVAIVFAIACIPFSLSAQSFVERGEVHGSFQADAQYYKPEAKIGADTVPEKMLMNGFMNVIYTNGRFSGGFRYEAYMNPMLGFDERLKGHGIPYRWASYRGEKFEITVGNFYEQFGNGLILRAYEEWGLGVDNSIDGIRVKLNLVPGITIKGVYGKQRYFWDWSPGIVRGVDGEISFNDLNPKWADSKNRVMIGGSFVSVFQEDDPGLGLNLPLNVGSYAGRINYNRGRVALQAEYARKINDPNVVNNYIYKEGSALYFTASYTQKGLGVILAAKWLDNMAYKSNRNELRALDVNFLPPTTRQHTYFLPSMYPYATQPNGEMGYQAQVVYTIPKKSKLGGKYGTTILANYSWVNSIAKTPLNDSTPVQGVENFGTLGYNTDFLKVGDVKYFHDFNLEITKKINRKWKLIASYLNQYYNIEIIEGHDEDPVQSNIFVLDVTYKFTPKKALRVEYQHLLTEQDNGDWMAFLAEYTIAPNWFFNVYNQWNYGNKDEDKQIHYYNASMGYTHKANRISVSYGRQRQGIVCVGGVCREVPASNGFLVTISSSF